MTDEARADAKEWLAQVRISIIFGQIAFVMTCINVTRELERD